MAKTGSVKVEILGDASKLKKATDDAEGRLAGFADKLKGFGAGLVAGFGVDKIGGFANDAIQMASGIGESLNKNAVVFGKGADQIAAAAKDAAKTVGLGEGAYLELAGSVGTLGKAAGLTDDALGDFGNTIISRAGDIGSFNNAATSDVIEAWGAAMRGEAEPMRKFGVLLDDASLRAQALKMGLIDNVKNALTPQQKALAANALIMEQTSDASGDFARTSDGLANKQKILKAQLDNVKTTIGSKLLPVMSSLVSWLSDKGVPAAEKFGQAIGPKLAAIVEWAKTNWPAFRDAIKAAFDWLATNVPPIVETVRAAVMTAFQWINDNVVPIVRDVVAFLVEQFGNLVAWVQKNWPAISEAIGHVIDAIAKMVEWVVDLVTRAWAAWGENILAIAKSAWDTIKRVIEAALGIVRGVIMTVVNLINGDWGKAWDSIKGVLKAALDGMFALLRGAVTIVAEILKAIWKPIETALAASWDWIKGRWNDIVGYVSALPGRIASAASGMWDGIKDSFRSAVNWIIGKWNSLQFTIGGGSFLGQDIPSLTLGTPDIPMLANGGIVNQPTIAMIGERGPEAVVPLRQGMGGFGGDTYVNNIHFSGIVDQSTARQVVDAIEVWERTNGRRFARAA